MSIERQTAVALKWTGIAKFGGQVVTWAITLVVLRLLSPADYGLMALVAVVISVLMHISEMGLGSSLVQAPKLGRDELARVNGLVIALNVAMCLLLVAAAPLVALAFHEERLVALIRVASLQFLLSGLATLPQSLVYREMRFKWLAFVDLTSVVSGGLTTLALAWYGAGVWALVVGSIVQSGVRTGLLLRDGFVRPRFERAGMRHHLQFGGIVTVGRVVWQLVYQCDVLIAGRYLPQAAVGLYSVSLHVATLPMQKIMGVINQVALPAVAKLQTELPRLRARLLEASRLLTFAGVGLLWGLSSVAPEFVRVVMGSQWHDAAYPLQVICLVVPLRMLNAIFSTSTIGIGRAAVDLRNSAVNVVVLPLAFFIGVQWGVNGLATSWAVAIPVVFAVAFPRISQAIGITLREVLDAVWAPVLSGAVMWGAVVGVRALTPQLHDAARLALLVAVGGLVYLGVSLSIDRRIRPEIRRLVAAF
jgi:O-antigen/teichoic acid export membrane protein